ncbi:hypothetical protein [Halobacillus sp. K22]
MKNLVRKAANYAKRNPQKTKSYARKAVNKLQNRSSKSKAK